MLSAKELHEIRVAKHEPKPLPCLGKKEFIPTFSPEERESIDTMIQERMSYMKEERVVKKNTLSAANWLPNIGLAEVTHFIGNGWESFGFNERMSGKLHLYPEEALFLLETAALEVSYLGTALSIQHAYSLLLKEEYCSLEKYRVYCHLRRQGYRVLRAAQIPQIKRMNDSDSSVPSKKTKMDSAAHFSTKLDTSFKFQQKQSLLFQRPAGDSFDYRLIPNFSGSNEFISIGFSDTSLLPESCANRQSNYVFYKKDFFDCASDLAKSERATCDLLDNPLFRGKTQPLLSRTNSNKSSNIYSRLKLFSEASVVPKENQILQISFHIFLPGSHFRKSNPGIASHAVVVTSWDKDFPSFTAIEHLRKQMSLQTQLMIALVGRGSDISYYQLEIGNNSLVAKNPNDSQQFNSTF